ncbi:MAG: response regulator transcription factor [Clostridiales bacterium]|nr:response regulator transcription factor [Clostridiales bacterium]
MRILLAEDDKTLSRGVTVLLEHDGYIVDAVADGQDAVTFAERESYDCIILDVMMPGLDGLSVVRKLRQSQNNAPVLILSAKGSLQDRVVGLDAGADDYLPKPFAGSELRARVRALLRRRTEYTPNRLTFADLTLDTGTCELSCAEKRIILSRRAYQVMEAFMRNPRMVTSPEQLMERIWGWDSEAEIHVVWVNVSFLRKQLTALGSRAFIKTLRGTGYSLEEQK